jgi:hypothetical protein
MVEDELVDVPVGVVLLMVELELEVEREEEPEMVPVPDEVEDKVEEEERASRMSNALVWERTEVTSPTGEAWKVYPGPAGTTGRPTVMFPSEVVTRFFMAKVLWKVGFVR